MGDYAYGDYVAYDTGRGYLTTGRVTHRSPNGGWFVCFHTGCTAANVPDSLLRPATEREVQAAPRGIGHHRFDAACGEYDPDACLGCRHGTVSGAASR